MKLYVIYGSIALSIFLCTLTYLTCIKRTKGFCYTKIHSRYGYYPRWDLGEPNPMQEKLLDQITAQSFSLLGSGKECYAFVSEDGEIVVKFFKQKHMRVQYLLNYLPLSKVIQSIRNETLNRHASRRKALYQSYQIAYERLPKETGLLYIHLSKSKFIKRPIHLVTPKGKNLTLKLDDMEFMVQKRAYLIFDEITAHPEKGREMISSILNLITMRNEKGIGDNDINCERNLGIINGTAVQIDVGEFYPSIPKRVTREELTTATLDLRAFLETYHPALVSCLEEEIDSLL